MRFEENGSDLHFEELLCFTMSDLVMKLITKHISITIPEELAK
jgi:hypothetical protein